MNKFIVTCGTSQLNPAIFKLTGKYSEFFDNGFNSCFTQINSRNQNRHLPTLFLPWVEQSFIPSLIDYLPNDIHEITDMIGCGNNPLGAELSTLQLLLTRKNGINWEPQKDIIVLLSSETINGEASALLIKSILETLYAVPPENISLSIISDFTEMPQSSETALDHLAEELIFHLDLDVIKSRINHYCIVMSGGFKSAIPCLTLTSFFFGIEMVYVFESSKDLQRLQPEIDLKTKKQREIWKNAWKELENQGLENKPKYLITLLKGRLTHPNRSFY